MTIYHQHEITIRAFKQSRINATLFGGIESEHAITIKLRTRRNEARGHKNVYAKRGKKERFSHSFVVGLEGLCDRLGKCYGDLMGLE